MARVDGGNESEIIGTRISCESFCNEKPKENRYVAKFVIFRSKESEPIKTNYRCMQGKQECGVLNIHNSLDYLSDKISELKDSKK